ncbi:MAG: polymer-forming cytoskeletal protein [Bacteroidetes bacterium]|nr:polymer-forming cytoskeletal protein [Bacteroidota bacterium]
MFTKSDKNAEVFSVNLIATGTQIVGDIKTEGDFRIDGSLEGSLLVKGKLVIGPHGVIKGEIECQNADISGEIRGKISVSELLALRASAKVTGDIFTGKISVEPDAQFTGNCSMGGVVKNIQHSDERSGKKTVAAAN